MTSVCVKCQQRLRVEESGVVVVVMFNDPPEPYQLWSGDIWRCPGCGAEIVGGMGARPIAERWQPGFADCLQQAQDAADAKGVRVVYDYERGKQ